MVALGQWNLSVVVALGPVFVVTIDRWLLQVILYGISANGTSSMTIIGGGCLIQ